MSPEESIRILNEASPDVLEEAISRMSIADRNALEDRIKGARRLQERRWSYEQVNALAARNPFFHAWRSKQQSIDLAMIVKEGDVLTQADVASYLNDLVLRMGPHHPERLRYETALRLLFRSIAAELRTGEEAREDYAKRLREGPPPLIIKDGVEFKAEPER